MLHEAAVQLPEHLPLPSVAHRLLAHALVATTVQAPEPLQTEAVVALPSVQVAAVQTLELSGKVPVPPQAVRVASGAPFTAMHLPTEPVCLQDSHCPSHLPSQQTPSAQ